jgi:hypothetical protein
MSPLRIIPLLLLTSCSTLTEIADLIPANTPQEQCLQQAGEWRAIISYDANNVPTQTGECVVVTRAHSDESKRTH